MCCIFRYATVMSGAHCRIGCCTRAATVPWTTDCESRFIVLARRKRNCGANLIPQNCFDLTPAFTKSEWSRKEAPLWMMNMNMNLVGDSGTTTTPTRCSRSTTCPTTGLSRTHSGIWWCECAWRTVSFHPIHIYRMVSHDFVSVDCCTIWLFWTVCSFRHIKEHLDGKVDPTANMTPEQLQFHYFNMHDLDHNGKLDGVELIKAITHFHSGE